MLFKKCCLKLPNPPFLEDEDQIIHHAGMKSAKRLLLHTTKPLLLKKTSRSDTLMALLGQKRRKCWNETIANIDFTYLSHKAWQTINCLTERKHKKKTCPVSANKIASVLVNNGK